MSTSDDTILEEIPAKDSPEVSGSTEADEEADLTPSQSAAKRDARWMAAIANNKDQKALTELFNIYSGKLKGWLMARGAGNGTAEDIVQDIMITCWTKAHMFDPQKASFATWVYRMTRNRFIDHKRKHGRMETRDPELMKTVVDDEVDSAEEEFISQENAAGLLDKMSLLSDVQAQSLRMAYMEFKTHQQISDETGVPLGTVKTRIRSAIAALKHHMDG